jgi:hypothetical protein
MSLLVPAEARTHIETTLGDVGLQLLLDAAEAAITEAVGPVGAVTEVLTAGTGDLVMLARRASAITSVSEYTVTLNANDYELVGSGRLLRRKDTGANPDSRWRGRLVVMYTPVSDLERRKAAQLALVRLDLDFNPGVASESIGDWSETYRTDASYVDQRNQILAGLGASFVLL